MEGLGVEVVFLGEDSGGQGLGGVVGVDGDFGLGEDWALVVFGGYEVDGGAGFGFSGGQDGGVDFVAVHSGASEFGEEGWVDVEDAVLVFAEGAGA